jgi:hypothetical protein
LDDGTGTILGVRVAVGNQACELLVQVALLADAGVHKSELGRGELSCCTGERWL